MTEKCDSFSWITEQLEEKWTSPKLDYISDPSGLNSNKSNIISQILNIVFYLHTLRREKRDQRPHFACMTSLSDAR